MIDIGCYIEAAIEWLTEEGAVFFDALNVGVESFIDSFQLALYAIPFYVFYSTDRFTGLVESG